MANKPKKKRNKQYRGADAAVSRPVVTRVSAVDRSAFGQWWFDHKRVAKPIIITVAVVAGVTWLIIEFVRIVSQ